MEPKDLKIKYDFSSGVIKNNQMIAEIEALKTTQAFKSVVADVDGIIPTILRPNGISSLKNFVLTDNPAYLEGRTLQGTVAQGAIAANGDYIIYIDPNRIHQDPNTGRVLSIGEIVTHEFGHSTKEGLAVTARGMNGQAGQSAEEAVANAYEHALAREKGLVPVSGEYSSSSTRSRLATEKPTFFSSSIPECFLAGTPVTMADGSEKFIESIKPDDVILAFDPKLGPSAPLVPKRVRRTFRNHTRTVIDLRGVRCTPGHVFFSGDGERSASFKTIAVILKDDGTIVDGAGTIVRARTGCPLDSIGDRVIQVAFRDPADGLERRVAVRAGIPVAVTGRQDGQVVQTLAAWLAKLGVELRPDGQVIARDGTLYDAVDWPVGSSPLDTIETQNWVVRGTDGRDYTPPWIAALSEQDERPALRIAG